MPDNLASPASEHGELDNDTGCRMPSVRKGIYCGKGIRPSEEILQPRLREQGQSCGKEENLMDVFMLAVLLVIIFGSMVMLLRITRKRGEDCPRYPYDCMYCRHAAECLIETGRKNEERRRKDEER